MARMELAINGSERAVEAPPRESLLSVLRNRLGLTGTKYGCGEGQCGACTVLVDGRAVKSCRTDVTEVVGKKITTIEGLAPKSGLHPVQSAFLEEEAFQCGFCTSGMIVATAALLETNPHPTREDAASALAGNICRCGTYSRILAAVARAAAEGKSKGAPR